MIKHISFFCFVFIFQKKCYRMDSDDDFQPAKQLFSANKQQPSRLPKIPEKQKLFACDKCDKRYGLAATLTRHKQLKHTLLSETRRSYSAMREFACESCSKKFSSKLYLNVHRRSMHDVHKQPKIPEEQKLFACDGCDKRYACAAALIKHKRSKHTLLSETRRSREFTCESCSKRFSSKACLRIHSKRKHRQINSSSVCYQKKKNKCSIVSCSFSCRDTAQLIAHLCEKHGQHLEFEEKTFSNINEFDDWRNQVEEDTPCRFTVRRLKSVACERTYYSCARSGYKRVFSGTVLEHDVTFT